MSAKRKLQARLHLIATGRVQGVFFRHAAGVQANALGLSGWVRNRSDGSVEIVAEGALQALRRLAQWAKSGPPAAEVAATREEWCEFKGEFNGFQVR
ncbi:MAG: acylphosphatase [Candidatus Binataceae bacterium]